MTILPGDSSAKFDYRGLKKIPLNLPIYADAVWICLKILVNYNLFFSVFMAKMSFTELM